MNNKMELGDLPMCELRVDMNFNDSENFCFGHQAMGCLPSSADGSSYASSFGPYTPVSRRSTPPFTNLLDHGSSFASSFNYELTPPASAMSSCFPAGPNTGNAPEFFQSGFPLTPSRNQFDVHGVHLNDFRGQLASHNTLMYSFGNDLGSSPLVPTPVQAIPASQTWEDSWSTWVQTGSPISFKSSDIQGLENAKGPSPSEAAARRRLFVEEARQKTTALQRAQGIRARAKAAKCDDSVVIGDGVAVSKIASGKHRCPHPNCQSKQYKRMEHLKRHLRSAHSKDIYKCHFCDKTFNRNDNRRQHHYLHTVPNRRAPRVKWVEGAEKALEEELKQIKPRRVAKTKKRIAAAS
ncbi:hypothetical protein B0H63DRAFT_470119 [Podospora didyma]|uniref:C2H2-type domain-containing protein n=1 Tax=Podospora didyma TaxID=330526 RepID=A0AAE0NTP1_9PEZI|nr:hypothetical protein B0H63DRAFT_470119 [Podospora didyma]